MVDGGKILKIIKRFGMNHIELNQAFAGDIVSIAGIEKGTVGHTINTPGKNHVIPSIPIDPPMISLTVLSNDSPLKGTEGEKCTINLIRERIVREAADDVSLRINEATIGGDKIEIAGRGDLHLGILIEKMRREGFEMSVTPPQVVMRPHPTDHTKKLEPFEEVTIEVDLDYCPMLIDKMNNRKGVLLSAEEQADGK